MCTFVNPPSPREPHLPHPLCPPPHLGPWPSTSITSPPRPSPLTHTNAITPPTVDVTGLCMYFYPLPRFMHVLYPLPRPFAPTWPLPPTSAITPQVRLIFAVIDQRAHCLNENSASCITKQWFLCLSELSIARSKLEEYKCSANDVIHFKLGKFSSYWCCAWSQI